MAGATPSQATLPVQAEKHPGAIADKNLLTSAGRELFRCDTPRAVFDTLLEMSFGQCEATLAQVQYQTEAAPVRRLKHSPQLSDNAASRLIHEVLHPLCLELADAKVPQVLDRPVASHEENLHAAVTPVVDLQSDRILGVISLIWVASPDSRQPILQRLDTLAGVAAVVLSALSSTPPAPALPQQGENGTTTSDSTPHSTEVRAASALDATVQVTAFRNLTEFAFVLVNQLTAQLKAEEVSFGVYRNQRIQILATSGSHDFRESGSGIDALRQAMEESCDARQPLLIPDEGSDAAALHQEWSRKTGNSAVCSVPILLHEAPVAVISLRRPEQHPLSTEEADNLQQQFAGYASAISLLKEAERPPRERLKALCHKLFSETLAPQRTARRLALAVFCMLMLWFTFGSLTYRPVCPARVSAADMNYITQPFDGRLEEICVRPGDVVQTNQLLARLDTSSLRLELSTLTRSLATSSLEMRTAISAEDVQAAAASRARMRALSAQVSRLNEQIRQAEIRAPGPGVILSSTVTERQGQSLPQGEELFRLAAEDSWQIEIEIPDDIITCFSTDQMGQFVSSARPDESVPLRLHTLNRIAEVRDGRNIFVARADLSARPSWLMTGMEGNAQITTVPRRVWWVSMHRVVDWFHTSFWI